jgi:hypothetical protein
MLDELCATTGWHRKHACGHYLGGAGARRSNGWHVGEGTNKVIKPYHSGNTLWAAASLRGQA